MDGKPTDNYVGTNSSEAEGGTDALTELMVQNRQVEQMLDLWEEKTSLLSERDSVDDRWKRGSAAKLLLQHMAVREAAKQDVVARLHEVGQSDLADRLEADGPARRKAIARLDETARGHQAINLNYPDTDRAVADLAKVYRRESQAEQSDILPAVSAALGGPSERGLPGSRSVQRRSDPHPNPVPKWYDKVKAVKVIVSFYDHLRSTPSGGTSPRVDKGREHVPEPRSR